MNLMILFIQLLFAGLLIPKGSATFKDRCGDPGVPAHGRLKKMNSSDAIEYECDMEYRLIGNSKRHCQANGTWDSPIPYCEPNLFYKMAIGFRGGYLNENLWKNFQGKTGTSVPIGPEPIDHELPEPTPIKEIILTSRLVLNATFVRVFVTIKNQTKDPGLNCTLRSYPGMDSGLKDLHFDCPFVPAKVVSIATSGSNQQLSRVEFYGDLLLEGEICGASDSPTNGSALRENGTFNYKCNQGFQLLGNNTVTCKGGKWSDQAPVCVYLSATIDQETVTQSNTTGPTEFHGWGLALLIPVVVVFAILVVGILPVVYWKRKQLSTEKISFKSLFA